MSQRQRRARAVDRPTPAQALAAQVREWTWAGYYLVAAWLLATSRMGLGVKACRSGRRGQAGRGAGGELLCALERFSARHCQARRCRYWAQEMQKHGHFHFISLLSPSAEPLVGTPSPPAVSQRDYLAQQMRSLMYSPGSTSSSDCKDPQRYTIELWDMTAEEKEGIVSYVADKLRGKTIDRPGSPYTNHHYSSEQETNYV